MLNPSQDRFTTTKVISTITGDVLLSLKEINFKTRELASGLVELMGNKMKEIQVDGGNALKDYLGIIVAGMAGVSPALKSASIIALAKVFYHFRAFIDDEWKHQLIKPVVILLSGTTTREVVKSCLTFIHILLVSSTQQFNDAHIGNIVKTMSNLERDIKVHFRSKIKTILQYLVKVFGYQRLITLVPDEDHKLLNHIKKLENRKAKKKEKTQDNQMHDGDEGEGAEDQSDDELMEVLGKSKKSGKKTAAWLLENDEPMDFLDVSSSRGVVAKDPSKKNKQKEKDDYDDKDFEYDDDGKMIIPDSDEEAKKQKKSRGTTFEDLLDEQAEEFDKTQRKKRKQLSKEEGLDSDEEEGPSKKRKQIQVNKKQKPKKSNSLGAEFKAKKASGDVMRAGRQEPYAYIPLHTNLLNRRKRHQATADFKNIANAARKGAQNATAGRRKVKVRRK